MLALVGARHIVHVNRLRVKSIVRKVRMDLRSCCNDQAMCLKVRVSIPDTGKVSFFMAPPGVFFSGHQSVYFTLMKTARREADNLSVSNIQIRNKWSYTATPPCFFMMRNLPVY